MIEMKNEAESLIYQSEKNLKENDSKLTEDVKTKVRSDIASLNESLTANNAETTKKNLENLRNSAMEMGRVIYQSANQNNQQQEQPQQEQPKKEEDEKK